MNNFERAFKLIAGPKVEAGLSLDPHDPGNWTGGEVGKGLMKGSNHGISAKRYPNEDIEHLTIDRTKFLYSRDYWLPNKCDTLEWGKALVVFDTAINGGPVSHWLSQFGKEPLADFLRDWQVEHIIYLSSLPIWQRESRGWMRRMFLVYEEAKRSSV